jgi:hypothetical protein
VTPALGRTGAISSQPCGTRGFVIEGSTAAPPAQHSSLPALSMAAVSPDGKYLAVVNAARNAVYVGPVTDGTPSFSAKPRLTGSAVTALSWDGSDDLWVADDGSVSMLPPGSGTVPVLISGSVSTLSVAPDGVRIAYIAQNPGQAPALYLAAIGGGQQGTSEPGLAEHMVVMEAAAIGSTLANPGALTWYDADNLVVLDIDPGGNTLWEVPVDGQLAQQLPAIPSGVTSITADGTSNVLVAGLSGNSLAVSTSLEGPWLRLGHPGQSPAYPG